MPVIWDQDNDQRLIKAIWQSESRDFNDIGCVFFGHPVKVNSAEYQQIRRRIYKLVGKGDSVSPNESSSRSPKGVQKKKPAGRRRKSKTPSDQESEGGFDEDMMFPDGEETPSEAEEPLFSTPPPPRSARLRACRPKILIEPDDSEISAEEAFIDEKEQDVIDEGVADL
ncbi:hypothetical protein Slin15195_G121870 [Septoria linicola]|uniref:Uncharacterized protein n=1 Tax=Septoria linicola TaxID=215465 RepID=A0A9Q9B4M5_9PEZI|nr:hypothetical protein Slin15195_G121870 [Septoria linicola]